LKHLIFVLLFLIGCSTESTKNQGARAYTRNFAELENKDSAYVSWDPPQMYFDSVQYYELFYRPESDSGWTMLKSEVPLADTPKVLIYRTDLPSEDSIFYFAVRSVSTEGMKSDFHFCTDSTALPKEGWYVLWPNK